MDGTVRSAAEVVGVAGTRARRASAPQDDPPGPRGARSRAGAVAAILLGLASVGLAAPTPASAQGSPPGTNASSPTPVTEPKVAAGAGPGGPACPARPERGVNEASNVIVTLDPDTLWRPRGGEVRFTVKGKDGATVQVGRVQACLGWSAAPGAKADGTASTELLPSPIVRSINPADGGAAFGATVPDLSHIPTPWWPPHLAEGTAIAFTAFDTVPVADMVVQVTLSGAAPVTLLVPVGVTSVPYAIVVVALCLAGFFFVARRIVRGREAARSGGTLLGMVSAPDGYASLSKFQILLWTVTVGATAVYVMVLSGNLINLTDGTLVLLGIAGGAALAARIPSTAGSARDAPPAAAAAPGATGPAAPGPTGPAPAGATGPAPGAAAGRTPKWSDLVVVRDSVDLTRVQMLVFTLVSAAFVVLQVVVTYVIPDIPANFLLLMGISNGVYVTGRSLPDRPAASLKE